MIDKNRRYSHLEVCQLMAAKEIEKTKVCLILGSGQGALVGQIMDVSLKIPYDCIEGLGPCNVQGHESVLQMGSIAGVQVACFTGRYHWYAGASNSDFLNLMSLIKCIGGEILIQTNSAGAIREDIKVGDLVLITDHINFQYRSPLSGLIPVQFVDIEQAYDLRLRQIFEQVAAQIGVAVQQGVYCGVLGPNFETAAEIRSLKILGADLVGMSTVPDTIAACSLGLKVAALSLITNLAVGFSSENVSHQLTLKNAKKSLANLAILLQNVISKI